MQKKYKTALIIIILLFCGVIVCAFGYLNYDSTSNDLENAFVYVDGNLSFNFIDGNKIETSEEEKNYQFSVTNTSSDPYYYNIALENVKSGDSTEIELLSTREGFQKIEANFPKEDSKIANTIRINGNETHSYTLMIKNQNKTKTIGTISMNLEKEMTTFQNIILKNNVVSTGSKTNIASEPAKEEEGLIETTDNDGIAYYFRGNINNNYVVFAGLLWRIVKINGDGSVKLILNDLMNNNTQYYASNEEFDLTFTNSQIYKNLEEWYKINLSDQDSLIANYKFCSDTTDGDNGYATITRIYTNNSPIFECMGNTFTSKIGLLTADEVALAGGSKNSQNKDFYLYNTNLSAGWWTMSPAKNNHGNYSFIEIYSNGQMNEGTSGTLFRGSRPVINLIRKTSVTGSGTAEDPYIVNNV